MNYVEPIRDSHTVIKICDYLKQKSERNFILCFVGFNTALRISDILPLTKKDVKGEYLSIREIKTSKQKLIPISKELRKVIDPYIENMLDSDYLFPSKKNKHKPITRVQAYNILKDIGREFKLTAIGTHTLRKTFARKVYEQTKDIVLVQTLLNHSDPNITKRYIGLQQEDLNAIYRNIKY